MHISKSSKVGDVIRHIMTVYQKDKMLSDGAPLQYPLNPEAYELRLIDEEKNHYMPFYEVGALDRRERIGDYESLAFVQNKNFKPKTEDSHMNKELMEELKRQNVTKPYNLSFIETSPDCAGKYKPFENEASDYPEP